MEDSRWHDNQRRGLWEPERRDEHFFEPTGSGRNQVVVPVGPFPILPGASQSEHKKGLFSLNLLNRSQLGQSRPGLAYRDGVEPTLEADVLHQ